MLLFLAGVGFQHFAKSLGNLRGDKGGGKKNSPAGGLVQQLMASRAMPQMAGMGAKPGGMPAMLGGGDNNGFLALLARLGAAANKNSQGGP